MRAAWLALGLAVVPAGALFLLKRRSTSAPTTPAPIPPASTEPTLSPTLNATLKQWLDALDVDNLGTPEHKVPSAETIGGASVFANELQAGGYPIEADALRTAIALSSGNQPMGAQS